MANNGWLEPQDVGQREHVAPGSQPPYLVFAIYPRFLTATNSSSLLLPFIRVPSVTQAHSFPAGAKRVVKAGIEAPPSSISRTRLVEPDAAPSRPAGEGCDAGAAVAGVQRGPSRGASAQSVLRAVPGVCVDTRCGDAPQAGPLLSAKFAYCAERPGRVEWTPTILRSSRTSPRDSANPSLSCSKAVNAPREVL